MLTHDRAPWRVDPHHSSLHAIVNVITPASYWQQSLAKIEHQNPCMLIRTPTAHRIRSLWSNFLPMATPCAAAVVAACTAPVMRATTTPSAQVPALALSVTRAEQEAVRLDQLPATPMPHTADPPIDHSGRKEVGKASFYARHFDGRKMANGRRFNPALDVAASKILPIGTTAEVINLDTGKSATVTVEDRGPYVGGRILDVSPKIAETLRMKKSGIAHVVVKPIAVPQQDGGVKVGAGAADMAPSQLATLITSRANGRGSRWSTKRAGFELGNEGGSGLSR
jgi:rare lipoprotein A